MLAMWEDVWTITSLEHQQGERPTFMRPDLRNNGEAGLHSATGRGLRVQAKQTFQVSPVVQADENLNLQQYWIEIAIL